MQGLKLRLESETKELKQTQTKKSMEDAKILNLVSAIPLCFQPARARVLYQFVLFSGQGNKDEG